MKENLYEYPMNPEWKYCVLANIKREHVDTDGAIRYGSQYFPGGRKVYLSNRYWKDEGHVLAMGLNRYKSKYILEYVPLELLENIRCRRIFKPRVVELMNEDEFADCWWTYSHKARSDAEAFAAMLQIEQISGTGHEEYLKKRLIRGFDEEIQEQERRLGMGWYMDDYIPANVIYDRVIGYPDDIIKEALIENPEYLKHWPLLKQYLCAED